MEQTRNNKNTSKWTCTHENEQTFWENLLDWLQLAKTGCRDFQNWRLQFLIILRQNQFLIPKLHQDNFVSKYLLTFFKTFKQLGPR